MLINDKVFDWLYITFNFIELQICGYDPNFFNPEDYDIEY